MKRYVDMEDAVDASFGGIRAVDIENEATGRKVKIVLSDNCVRWMGFATGIEAHYMASAKKCRQYSYGWVPVNGRHEFKDEGREKCIKNAVRWVNQSARSYV